MKNYFKEQEKFIKEQNSILNSKLEDKKLNQIKKDIESKAINSIMQNQLKFWNAGSITQLNQDWIGSILSPNQELKQDIKQLKIRARDLYNNSEEVKSFVKIVQQHIKPFKLSSSVANSRKGFNTKITTKIEDAWEDFCKPGNIDVTGKFSLNDILDQLMIQYIIDGEILVRKISGKGKYGFQLQLLHTDQLAIEMKNSISGPYAMGIEFDQWDKPVKYFISKKLPTEGAVGQNYLELPADEIIHIFAPHAIGAVRGVPYIVNSMEAIRNLDTYTKAVITAAQMAACLSVTYTQDGLNSGPYDGATNSNLLMTPGSLPNALTPGMAEALPPGVKKEYLTPNQPTQSYKDFVSEIKSDIASGLGISKTMLYNQFDTSFSSNKAALLQDKYTIVDFQTMIIEKFLDVIFSDFIDNACALGKLQLPAINGSYEIYKSHKFIGKGFEFLDPLKDIEARIAALDAGLTTRTELLNEQGKDLEDTLSILQKEKQLMSDYGITIINPQPVNDPALGRPGTKPNTQILEDDTNQSQSKDKLDENK